MEITDAQVAHWREHGYVVLERFFSDDELAEAQEAFRHYFPTWQEYIEAPRRHHWVHSGPIRHFPFDSQALNQTVTHPSLIGLVERLLGTEQVLLAQAILVAKYAGATTDEDQPLHVDLDDNSLVYPPGEGRDDQIPIIFYLTDVTRDTSPTFIVSRRHTRDRFLWPTAALRRHEPALYEFEQPLEVPAGSVLVHSMRTFHRGSGFREEGHRFAQHVVYRHIRAHWTGWSLWARQAEQPAMIRFLESASPRQREVLGFPPVDHDYWTEETIGGVAARYPKMVMDPYWHALRRRTG